jgi:hypothetical protein
MSNSCVDRDFIEKYLLDFTRSNPGVVVYLKPRRHRQPSLVAEYCKYAPRPVSISGGLFPLYTHPSKFNVPFV